MTQSFVEAAGKPAHSYIAAGGGGGEPQMVNPEEKLGET